MARKHAHEEHTNHEAWAIPYGDLITLLLAFFVVMYAISSVNEGKYRVLADSLNEAFGGSPRTIRPINVGQQQLQGSDRDRGPPMQQAGARGPVAPLPLQNWPKKPQIYRDLDSRSWRRTADDHANAQAQAGLRAISKDIENALAGLIDKDLVTVRRTEFWVEVEIKSDILFASGSALPMPDARPTLEALAHALAPFPNLIRIEGHTDNVPIATAQFPSNWELSAARAASVLHLFEQNGVDPQRLTMIGNGEFRPIADNATDSGRNANRRVLVVILAHLDDDTSTLPAAADGDTTLAPPGSDTGGDVAPDAAPDAAPDSAPDATTGADAAAAATPTGDAAPASPPAAPAAAPASTDDH